ncbi:hypothetical protein Tco_0260120 [Tanacetum coccineum]
MFQICLNLPGQKFEDPPFEEEILTFIRKLRRTLGNKKSLGVRDGSDVRFENFTSTVRTFGTIINKCLSDLVYQIKNKEAKKNKDMYYPRFTKVIINHFMLKDQSIPRRNKVDWHMANNDPILTTMRFIPKHETVQKYGAILPDTLTNQSMKESDAYMWSLDSFDGSCISDILNVDGNNVFPNSLKPVIMVNVIPPDHDHDVPVVEPNQHDDVLVVPEPVLEDKDEDPEEDEFEEEEDPQEDEDDMEIDIEEDENEPELTYPYEEVDPLNPPPPASESEPDNEIENPIEHEDETVPVSVYEVGESSTAAIPQEDGDRLLPGFMRRDIDSLFGRMVNFSRRLCGRETAHALVKKKGEAKDRFYGKLILDLGNEVRSSVEQGTAAMEKLVEKLENVEEKAECKKLKKELEEARLSNTFLRMQNERVERDLYWTRVRAHEFYQEMIRRGFVFEERPNEAIDVSIEDEKSPLSEPRGSPPDV